MLVHVVQDTLYKLMYISHISRSSPFWNEGLPKIFCKHSLFAFYITENENLSHCFVWPDYVATKTWPYDIWNWYLLHFSLPKWRVIISCINLRAYRGNRWPGGCIPLPPLWHFFLIFWKGDLLCDAETFSN